MPYTSDRRFKLWDYSVSHKQLLIRSPRTPEIATNIDLVFWDVQYVALNTTLDGITLDVGSSEDSVLIEQTTCLRINAGNVYRLRSGGIAFWVVASGFKVLQNELDIFDSTLVVFAKDRPPEELGQVLCRS